MAGHSAGNCLCIVLPFCYFFAQQTETDSTRLRLPDSFPIVQRIGIDLRPTYIAPTHEFLRGTNNKQHALRKAFSAHLKWAFQFHPFSETGSIYPHTYQGIGLSYNSFESAQEIGSPTALFSVFQGSSNCPAGTQPVSQLRMELRSCFWMESL